MSIMKNNWHECLLEDALDLITYGLTVRPKYHTEGVPLISAREIRSGNVNLGKAPKISVVDYNKLSAKGKPTQGDILFSKTGSIGHCAIVENNSPFAITQNAARLVFNSLIDNRYALWYLRSPYIQRTSQERAKGNAVKDLQLGDMKKFKFIYPPLLKQKKIAAILDTADSYRQKTKALVAKYDELTQSLFLDMFGDPVSNPKGYEQRTLLELTTQITDGTHHTPTYTESGIPFLRVTDVTGSNDSKKFISVEEHKQLIKRCQPAKGDILYTKNGTIGVGKIVSWDYEFSIFVSLCLLKPNHEMIDVKYLNHFLNTPFAVRQAMRHSKEATIKNLHLVEIRKMLVPYPSLEEQKDFVAKLEVIESQKEQAQASLDKAEELFNSLLQKAFKGELV